MDIAESLVSRSDQLNAEDLAKTGPQTYTIREVVKGKAEQPFDFLLVETDRAWRPPITVRRLVAAAWETTDSKIYEGRRVTLYCDPKVTFGGETPGGIRVSHMSHLRKRWQGKIKTARGKRETFTVDPLLEAVSAETLVELAVMFERKGIAEDQRLSGVNHLTGGSATALEVITEDQARHVLSVLEGRPDAEVQP